MKYFYSILLIFLVTVNLAAQPANSNTAGIKISFYDSRDYKASSQNWAIRQDSRGVLYFGNNDGILIYSGKKWQTIPVKNRTIVRSLAIDEKDRLFVGAANELGYLAYDENGAPLYVSLLDKLDPAHHNFNDIGNIFITDYGIYFCSQEKIFIYRDKGFEVIEGSINQQAGITQNNKIITFEKNLGLVSIEKNQITKLEGTGDIHKKLGDFYFLIPYATTEPANTLLLGGSQGKMYLYDIQKAQITQFPHDMEEYSLENAMVKGIRIDDNKFAFSTLRGGIFILNNDGTFEQLIDSSAGFRNNQNWQGQLVDREGNLWTCLDAGIGYLDFRPPLHEIKGVKSAVRELKSINNTIYAAAQDGLYYLPGKTTAQGYETGEFQQIYATNFGVWSILEIDNTIILGSDKNKIFAVKDNKTYDIPLGEDVGLILYLARTDKFKNYIFAATQQNGIYVLEITGYDSRGIPQVSIKKIFTQFKDKMSFKMLPDSAGNLWINLYAKGLGHIRFSGSDIKDSEVTFFTETEGLPSPNWNIPTYWNGELVIKTENGIYDINEILAENNPLEISPDQYRFKINPDYNESLAGVEIMEEMPAAAGDLWVLYASETAVNQMALLVQTNQDEFFLQDINVRPTDDRIMKFTVDNDGVLWLGGRKSIYRYQPGAIAKDIPLITLFTDIKVNRNESIYKGSFYNQASLIDGNYTIPSGIQPGNMVRELPYEENSLMFEYNALWFQSPETLQYSFKLEGYDQNWSEWSSDTKKEYTNLEENYYTFKVKARRNLFGIESEVSEFSFIILSPWFRTGWAYFIYSLLLAVFIVAAARIIINRRLVVEKKRLETKVKEQTKELWNMDKQKILFYQNITHELRTPLTLIIGHLENLTNKPGYKDADFSDEIPHIDRNARKLHHLINQLLDLTKIDFNAMTVKPAVFLLPDFIKHLAGGFNSLAKTKKITFKVEIDNKINRVYLDIHKLEDILTNLLSNAFKFTAEDGTIKINAYLIEENRLGIDISDTGIGIAEKDLPYIFDRFRQVDGSTSRKYEGTGIGLSLALEYAEMLGGMIKAASRPGKGSCFSVHLPVSYKNRDISDADISMDLINYNFLASRSHTVLEDKPEDANHSGSWDTIPESKQKPVILIVEDNPELLNFVDSCLKPVYNTITAQNGQEALKTLEKSPRLDLIISDIMMPEMDGYQFYRSLKQNTGYQQIPFIFMTAKTSIDDQVKGLEQGAVDYITKPFSVKTLIAKINALLRFNKLRTAMHEREQFASLGKLVSAVSHEILNPLAGMSGPVYYLKDFIREMDSEEKGELTEAVAHLDSNINRIDTIVKNLRSLSRFGVNRKSKIYLRILIDNVLVLLKNKIKKQVSVTILLDDEYSVMVNPGALSHILLNLVSNAYDAVGESGEITIRAEKSPGGVTIEIEDNGCGISEKDLPHIFDLYFTTKSYNEGSGFGLYFVKDLVTRMGWTIEVESEVNKGTVFTLSEGVSTSF